MDFSLSPRKKVIHYIEIDKMSDWIINFKTITELHLFQISTAKRHTEFLIVVDNL